ncbi:MAG: hypothetical protein QOJ24_5350 [Mycobacterium sp.]|nr:hypothetical protein [Mycobacterium sp.]
MPETSYAPCGDLSLAYQVFGDGPVELVWAGPFASHVELFLVAKRTPWILRGMSRITPTTTRPASNDA